MIFTSRFILPSYLLISSLAFEESINLQSSWRHGRSIAMLSVTGRHNCWLDDWIWFATTATTARWVHFKLRGPEIYETCFRVLRFCSKISQAFLLGNFGSPSIWRLPKVLSYFLIWLIRSIVAAGTDPSWVPVLGAAGDLGIHKSPAE